MNSKFQVVDKTYEHNDSSKLDIPQIQINIESYDYPKRISNDKKEFNLGKLLDNTISSNNKAVDNYSWNEDISKCNNSFNSKNYIPKVSVEAGESSISKKKSFTQKYINALKQEDASLNHLMIKSKFYKGLSEGGRSAASNSNQSYMGYLDNSIFNCLEIEGPNLNEMEMDKIKVLHSPSTERNDVFKKKMEKRSPKRNSLFLPALSKQEGESNIKQEAYQNQDLLAHNVLENNLESHKINIRSSLSLDKIGIEKQFRVNDIKPYNQIFRNDNPSYSNQLDINSLSTQFDKQCNYKDNDIFNSSELDRKFLNNTENSSYGFQSYQPSQNLNSSYLQYMPSNVEVNSHYFYGNQLSEPSEFNKGFNRTPNNQYGGQSINNSVIGLGSIPYQPKSVNVRMTQLTNLLQTSKEQAGCRMLQKHIEESSEFANFVLYPQIKSHIVEISLDQFGNYLVQKLLEKLIPDHIHELSKIMIGSFKIIASSQFGTRVMQKLIEYIEINESRQLMIHALNADLVELANHSQANHVVSKILTKFPPEDIAPLNEIFIENLETIVKDKYGCCVIQKLIERSHEHIRRLIIENLLSNVSQYILDPFANYVLQLSVTYNYRNLNFQILNYVKQNFLFYSLEKFSSNVIEKALSFCSEDIRDEIIDLIQKSEEVTSKLLLDLYGNHILQKALIFANEKAKENILTYIAKYIDQLDKTTHGPKLKSRLLTSFSFLNTLLDENSTTKISFNSSVLPSKPKHSGKFNTRMFQDPQQTGNYIYHNQPSPYQIQLMKMGNPQIPQLSYHPNSYSYPNQVYQPQCYYPNLQGPYSGETMPNYQVGYNPIVYNPQVLPQQIYQQQYPYPSYEYPMYVGNHPESYYLNSK